MLQIVPEPFPIQTVGMSPQLQSSPMLQPNIIAIHESCKPFEADECVKSLSIVSWYRILRAHHHWTVFQAIRYALWLTR